MLAKPITPVSEVIDTAPPALPAPGLFVAPVVTRLPANVIVPVPVVVMVTAPEVVPLLGAAVVVMLLATVRLTFPPVRVTAFPALVTLSVTWIDPEGDRMITGFLNVELPTTIAPLCVA
jgi:hypothetical protein